MVSRVYPRTVPDLGKSGGVTLHCGQETFYKHCSCSRLDDSQGLSRLRLRGTRQAYPFWSRLSWRKSSGRWDCGMRQGSTLEPYFPLPPNPSLHIRFTASWGMDMDP